MSKKRRGDIVRDLPPEVKAVTFAKCSRSEKNFDEIAEELTEEKSAEFHEKWVVGYGHSSVAEHAILNIAVENISRLACEVLENNRLASYTEKSSRYQIFHEDDFYFPQKIEDSELKQFYSQEMKFLVKNYLDFYEKILNYLKTKETKKEDEEEAKFEARLRPIALDTARFIMPVAMSANVGVTMNARCLEYAITKMLSHPLGEVQDLGKDIKKVSQSALPTLVKYAQPNIYLMETEKALKKIANKDIKEKSRDQTNVILVDYRVNAEGTLAADLLYRFSHLSFLEVKDKVRNMTDDERREVINETLKRLGNHDVPLRELEHIYYSFDCLMDEGAYYEFKRHRMCTQTVQDLTIENGYAVPPLVEKNNELKRIFTESIEKSENAFKKVAEKFPHEAKYFVLNAHKRRVLITLNLRALYHFIKLRSAPNAHFTIQEISNRMYELAKEKHPFLLKFLKLKK